MPDRQDGPQLAHSLDGVITAISLVHQAEMFSKADDLYDQIRPKEALEMYLALVDSDPTGWALFRCGDIYYNNDNDGTGLKPRDQAKGVDFFRKSSPLLANISEDVRACYALGRLHEVGEGGVQLDKTKAVGLYKLAAERGYPPAQNKLGWMYNKGEGIQPDEVEAVKWRILAAEGGHTLAQYNLGAMYQRGKGQKDKEEAVRWFTLSAKGGNTAAQSFLGWMYDEGEGVQEDKEEAAKWYRRAAEGGFTTAQINLGWMYRSGEGVQMDTKEAIKWYRHALDGGDLEVANILGNMYLSGEGAEKSDKLKAFEYFNCLVRSGEHPPDQIALRSLLCTTLSMESSSS